MKTLNKIITLNFLLLSLVVISVVSCKDEEPEALNLSRQFKPTEFELTNGETSANIAWAPSLFTIPGDVEYVVEISQDPVNFSNVEYTTTTAETNVTVLDTDLTILTDYYARVKAVGSGNAEDSKWAVSEAFQITGEIFILPLRENDYTETEAIISWSPEQVLTKLVITPLGGEPIEFAISAEEAAAGQKHISDLTPSTTYKAEVFFADVTKGSTTFKTKPMYEDSYNVIDLRGITGKPKILVDTLPDIASGSIIYLKRGERYTVESTDVSAARNFNKSVTIMSGPGFDQTLARIDMTTNFNIVAGSVIDSLVFRDVQIKGARANGASFDSDYILNVNAVGSIGKMRLDNVKVSRLRGLVRLQTATTGAKITDYYVNNCVVDSIREFAVVMASASSSFTNVKISNSTFTRCRRFVNHGVAGNSTMVIENCTFNEVPSGGVQGAEANYFIDLNNNTASIVTIRNCIIGKGWNEGAGEYVHGIRLGAGSSVNVENSYNTSDFLATNATYQIPGLLALSIPSTSLWANTATHDFTIVNSSFPAAETAGDPRWRQ
jgi:hypothetical protein